MRFLVGGCKNNLKNDNDVNIAVKMWNFFCLGIEKFYSGVKQRSDWFYSETFLVKLLIFKWKCNTLIFRGKEAKISPMDETADAIL